MGEQIEIPFENKFIWKVGDLVPTVDQTLNYWPIAFCVEGKWIMRITADYHIEFNRATMPPLFVAFTGLNIGTGASGLNLSHFPY